VEAITLYARYQDDDNNLSCTFTNAYVKISQKLNGVTTVLSQTTYKDGNSFKTPFGIALNDKAVICSKGDTLVIGSLHPNAIKNGGIALSIWDAVLKDRTVSFSAIRADEVQKLFFPKQITLQTVSVSSGSDGIEP
jgi:hypothetical protein